MSWVILKTENEHYSVGVSWDVLWEDNDGFIHLAECGKEEDAKVIVNSLKKNNVIPNTNKIRQRLAWKEKKKC